MTFKVGDKVTSEEFGDGVVESELTGPELRVRFESGGIWKYTKDGVYISAFPQPTSKNIKHKEAQGMNKSDLKTGMVTEHEDGEKRLVLILDDIGYSISKNGWVPLYEFTDDLKLNENSLYNCKNIKKVFSVPERICDYIDIEALRVRIWQREEVKEMTVDEISKALGYPVKVVGGE